MHKCSQSNQLDCRGEWDEIGQNGKKILVLTARAITITIIIMPPTHPLLGDEKTLTVAATNGRKRKERLHFFAVAPSNDSHLNYVKWLGRRLQAPLNSVVCVCVCVCVFEIYLFA